MASVVRSIGSAVRSITSDPYLPHVVMLVNRLNSAESNSSGSGSSAPGIGLKYVVKPLGLYVTLREKPWMIPLLAAAVLGIPFLLGRSMR